MIVPRVLALLQTLPQLTRQLRRSPHTAAEFLEDVKDYGFSHGPRIVGILILSAIAWWMLPNGRKSIGITRSLHSRQIQF